MKLDKRRLLATAFLVILPIMASTAFAQEEPVEEPVVEPVYAITSPEEARTHGLESLRTLVKVKGVPLPPNLRKYVKDKKAAAQLGKALFHEMAVGSGVRHLSLQGGGRSALQEPGPPESRTEEE